MRFAFALMKRVFDYAAILIWGLLPSVLVGLFQVMGLLALQLGAYTTGDGEFRFYDQMARGVWAIAAVSVVASGVHIYQMIRRRGE